MRRRMAFSAAGRRNFSGHRFVVRDRHVPQWRHAGVPTRPIALAGASAAIRKPGALAAIPAPWAMARSPVPASSDRSVCLAYMARPASMAVRPDTVAFMARPSAHRGASALMESGDGHDCEQQLLDDAHDRCDGRMLPRTDNELDIRSWN